MVDSNHDMWDTLVQVSGPWKAEPDDERGAILIVWNMGSIPREGASLTVDIKAKLRKLTAIDRDHSNWSWLWIPTVLLLSLIHI